MKKGSYTNRQLLKTMKTQISERTIKKNKRQTNEQRDKKVRIVFSISAM